MSVSPRVTVNAGEKVGGPRARDVPQRLDERARTARTPRSAASLLLSRSYSGDATMSTRGIAALTRGGGRRTIAVVAYDEELAHRLRELVAAEPDLTELKMFGGLAFLIRGNMAIAASGQGGILVRVDPAESKALVATTAARPMEMRGGEMDGWLRVDAEHVRTKRELAKWAKLGRRTRARSRRSSARRHRRRAGRPARRGTQRRSTTRRAGSRRAPPGSRRRA
jgi:TfoX/Sxy family transcriptional regulator of competence genes